MKERRRYLKNNNNNTQIELNEKVMYILFTASTFINP